MLSSYLKLGIVCQHGNGGFIMAKCIKIKNWREEILSVVGKNNNLKTLFKGLFIIAYLHLMKYFFLLPVIIADYNCIVNSSYKIVVDILIISIYSFLHQSLFTSEENMQEELVYALLIAAVGVPFSI